MYVGQRVVVVDKQADVTMAGDWSGGGENGLVGGQCGWVVCRLS